MKKMFVALSLLLMVAFCPPAIAQVNVTGSGGVNKLSTLNSSTTELDSAAIFTGRWELCYDYASIQLSVKSNQGSTTQGVKIQFADQDKSAILSEVTGTYEANDSTDFELSSSIRGTYFRVIYGNTTAAQTTFVLETLLNARGDRKTQIIDGSGNSYAHLNSNFFRSDTLTIGTTAVALPDSTADWVSIMNTSNALVYLGGAGVNSNTGYGAISQYETTDKIYLTNLSDLYLVSNVAGTVIRYFYGRRQ